MKMIKSIDYRVAMLLLLTASSPFVSPNIALPVSIIAFSGMILAKSFIKEKPVENPSEELANEIKAIKNQMSSIMIKNAAKPEEMAKEMKRFF